MLDNGFGNHTGTPLFGITTHASADDKKDYVLLRSIIKEKKNSEWKSPEEVRDFFKLEKKVWMGERRDVETVASVGRDLLGHDYEILTRKWLPTLIYTQIDAIQGYELGRGYSCLVEAGVVNFWQDFGTRAIQEEKVNTFHKYMGVEGSARARDQFEPVGLRDSLTLEGLCLLGFGVAACFLVELTAMAKVLLRGIHKNCQKRTLMRSRMRYRVARNKISGQ